MIKLKIREKKELHKLKTDELQKRLQTLETEKQKLETWMHNKNGTSMLVRNYPVEPTTNKHQNIKNIKKNIAVIKTILHLRLLKTI